MRYTLFLLIFLVACNNIRKTDIIDITPNAVVPSKQQLAYQQMELIGFIHFTINTFTDKEWGYGDESPELFNPSELNVEQWARVARDAGMKQLILTAKHHDGFCLWPSAYTNHDISESPYKNGEGDVVGEFVDACRKYGLKAGLYLSPWDRNHKDYGKPEYLTYYRNQITELLTNYGEISEIWFDGANGGDGYYGGAHEVRKIDRQTYYEWDSTFTLVKELQPDILIFSDAGPDIHWIGNEHGFAGETFWSTFNMDSVFIGTPKTGYLNSGDPNGPHWVVGECDVSIRPGWFYHESQDSLVKSPQELVDIYYRSVGRNGVLLLNVPPDKRGLIHENDVRSLVTLSDIIDSTFYDNLALSGSVIADGYYQDIEHLNPKNILDDDPETYWAASSQNGNQITIEFDRNVTFDRLLISEPVRLGQRIEQFSLDIETPEGWRKLYDGTTIGYKRLIRTDRVTTRKVRLNIDKANNIPAIAGFGLYISDPREMLRH